MYTVGDTLVGRTVLKLRVLLWAEKSGGRPGAGRLYYNAGVPSELVMLGCAGWFGFGMQAHRVISEWVTHKQLFTPIDLLILLN